MWVLSHLAQWHNVLAFRTSGTLWDLWEAQTLLGWPSGMLAHSGMLACWHTCWHSRQTHGIQTNDDHHPLNLVDFRLQAVVVSLWFSGFTGFVMIRWSELEHSETAPTPKTEKYGQKPKPGFIYRTKNELAHTNW